MRNVSVGRLMGMIALLGSVLLVATACSGSSGGPQQPQTADPNVEALPGDRAEMQISLPDGSLPCGIGQVEWGQQIFQLDQFPACQSLAPAITVFCLDDQAQWTADSINVQEVTTSTITIEAQREGICALFPAK